VVRTSCAPLISNNAHQPEIILTNKQIFISNLAGTTKEDNMLPSQSNRMPYCLVLISIYLFKKEQDNKIYPSLMYVRMALIPAGILGWPVV
jgi:hypothetical protein